jgi:Uncharacterized membrane protein, required for colicin V production
MDMIVLLLVGGGAVLGVIRGFVTEVIALFAWVAAIAALKFFYTPAAAMLSHWISGSAGAILAFALVFGIVFIAGKLIASSLGGRVRNSILGPVDRGLGLGFGALKGLLVATLAFLLFNIAYDTVFGGGTDRPHWMRESRSFTLLEASSRAIVDFVEARRHPKSEKMKSGNTVST